jgi:hypothetical protein
LVSFTSSDCMFGSKKNRSWLVVIDLNIKEIRTKNPAEDPR